MIWIEKIVLSFILIALLGFIGSTAHHMYEQSQCELEWNQELYSEAFFDCTNTFPAGEYSNEWSDVLQECRQYAQRVSIKEVCEGGAE
jgi:hypothetical protein